MAAKREHTPTLNGIFETALFVENLARSRDFYQNILGMEKLRESESGCVFMVAKGQLLLLIAQEKSRAASQTPGGEVPPCLVRPGEALGAGHIAFAVAEAEFDTWRIGLESKGVEVLSLVAWVPGGRSLYFRDPDGHLVELATPGVWEPGN